MLRVRGKTTQPKGYYKSAKEEDPLLLTNEREGRGEGRRRGRGVEFDISGNVACRKTFSSFVQEFYAPSALR